jgi:uncharacterized membrane protein YdbT with pleckstrin-like domain
MSYLDRVLQPDETVIHRGKIHWLVYWPAAVFLLIALAGLYGYVSVADQGTVMIAAILVGGIGFVIAWLVAFLKRWSTEIAVTNRRVIFKEGLIARRTFEMNMEKIESVDVDQSIPGRIFNYGTVTVRGVGSGSEPLKRISSPLQLRNRVLVR